MTLRPFLRLALASVAVAVVLGSAGPASAGTTVPIDTPPLDSAPIATNDFIPDNANLGDCVSSLPRPGCGSEARSSTGQQLTFGVLLLATVLIGWRIVRSVRQRDSAADQQIAAERDGPADEGMG